MVFGLADPLRVFAYAKTRRGSANPNTIHYGVLGYIAKQLQFYIIVHLLCALLALSLPSPVLTGEGDAIAFAKRYCVELWLVSYI